MHDSREVVDYLKESLVPLADRTSEVQGSALISGGTIEVRTRNTRPVIGSALSASDEVTKDLLVDLKSNHLREDAG